ncbi:hypothetical protein ACFQFQ_31210 [Sulfitobacter porphyrae]|uniref:Uncharacterized protein n=1 Tax=Sulfitobacter porphyrae TaxID=1246864 RepID=A0ABW2BDR3_9RHOB
MLELDKKSSQELFKAAQGYLRNTLQVPSSLMAWSDKKGLPLFLEKGFNFRQTELLGHKLLLTVPLSESSQNPTGLSKQLGSLERHFEGIVVLVLEHLSAYQRSLIEESAAFIVPGNQLFIPQLAMDLQEHFRRRRDFAEDQLSRHHKRSSCDT